MIGFWEFFIALSLVYFVAINLSYTVLTLVSFLQSSLRVRQAEAENFDLLAASRITPPISIVIPAYNEEPMIVNAVATALEVDYPEFEIIVVNDGSNDRTLRRLIETFDLAGSEKPYRATLPASRIRRIYYSQRYPNFYVIDKENGGKADALNAGVNLARYRYIVNTDADTIFEAQALIRIIRPVVRDPRRVVAIGGQVRVGNGFRVKGGEIVERKLPSGLLPRFQIVEYLRTFLGNRVGWSAVNSMLLISGAFGCWRRDVLVSVGGFNREITGEDLEVTMRFHRVLRTRNEPYSVVSLPDPVCWTEGPEDLGSFYQQRNRWHRVLLESFWAHREMLLNPKYGTVGLLGMPYYLFFEIVGPFIEILSYFVILGSFGLGFLQAETMVLFLLLSIGYTTFLNTLAILIEEMHYHTYTLPEVVRLWAIGLLDNLGYRQLTMLIRVVATFDWIFRKRGWGTISREGFSGSESKA